MINEIQVRIIGICKCMKKIYIYRKLQLCVISKLSGDKQSKLSLATPRPTIFTFITWLDSRVGTCVLNGNLRWAHLARF